MSKFVFRVKTLLRARESRRDRLRAGLADALAQDEVLARRQAEFDARRRELLSRYREAAAPGKIDVEELMACRRHDRFIAEQQSQLEEQRSQTAQKIDRRRKTLLTADRGVRVLQMLEQKQEHRHREQQQRRETRALDEMTASRGGRQAEE